VSPERGRGRRSATSVASFKRAAEDNLYYLRGQAQQTASERDAYLALSYTVRDQLIDRFRRTADTVHEKNPRFVYFLSAEYLLGRQLEKNLLYTGTADLADRALADFGLDLDYVIRLEREPGLGNGGLGRLAACFLDSLATLDIPAVGYGIRYEYGIFRQRFEEGWQVEGPDEWLRYANPWEFEHPDDMVEVGFGGSTERSEADYGEVQIRWVPEDVVYGEPYHTLVPGYGTGTVNLLRLWRARAGREFDFQLFDVGDYARAVEQKVHSENISKVLYPNDNTPQGRELRLRQQYFFVACSLHDIIRRWRIRNDDWSTFPEKVTIQLNDTHPVVAIPELMRILIDLEGLSWKQAWHITSRTFASTQHTLLPEALEKWPVDLFGSLLPRHLEIVYEINKMFLDEVREAFPGDPGRVARMSLIEEGSPRLIRMAYLANVGSYSVNGVAELQSKLLREQVFKDFAEMWPRKFNNKTNGVTQRRFMKLANPGLSQLITERIGDGWLRDLDELQGLEEHVEDDAFRASWRAAKLANKEALAAYLDHRIGLDVDPASMYDVMVKRLHEYKPSSPSTCASSRTPRSTSNRARSCSGPRPRPATTPPS
jgi:starch phosphorylase